MGLGLGSGRASRQLASLRHTSRAPGGSRRSRKSRSSPPPMPPLPSTSINRHTAYSQSPRPLLFNQSATFGSHLLTICCPSASLSVYPCSVYPALPSLELLLTAGALCFPLGRKPVQWQTHGKLSICAATVHRGQRLQAARQSTGWGRGRRRRQGAPMRAASSCWL